ncbi:class I lanthipeptide [Taibaiella koreensis]|uniref:class I lanthipeptide n=1 Tax=Taibaiella koreensis TaxID=1268548 RepID=UPI000E599186|nr:class I lanthipeptide [Taibaiella koreensis]
MKKKQLALSRKLILKKNTIAELTGQGKEQLLGGALSDATTPCGVCAQTRTPTCDATQATQPVNMCNFAFSKIPGDCHATGNVACQSIKIGDCGTVISNAGGGCWGN